MTAPLLIHVGLHKTGTTWLQRRIFASRDGADIAYCGDVGRIHGAFINPNADRFNPSAARAAFADIEARATGKLGVLSDEGLGGRPFHARHEQEIYASRLAAAFPQAYILITIREQSRIIYSMYGQYLRYGYSSSLKAFLATPPQGSFHHPVFDRDYYDYDRMLALYTRHFPAENILVLPMEWMLEDPNAALQRISKITRVALDSAGDDLSSRIENPASSDLAYDAIRWANHLISQDSRWLGWGFAPNPNSIGHWVDRLTPDLVRRRMKARRMAFIKQAIGDSYATSNAALAAQIDIDLSRYGYCTA